MERHIARAFQVGRNIVQGARPIALYIPGDKEFAQAVNIRVFIGKTLGQQRHVTTADDRAALVEQGLRVNQHALTAAKSARVSQRSSTDRQIAHGADTARVSHLACDADGSPPAPRNT